MQLFMRNRKKGKHRVCFLICLIVFLSQSCQKNEVNVKVPLEKVTINMVKGNSSALLCMAITRGYFKEQLLDVEVNEFQSGKAAMRTLLSGGVDFVTAGEFAFVSQSFSNPNLKIFAVISTFKNKSIVTRKDKDVFFPNDLRGKKIGVTEKSGGQYFLGTFLASNGITRDDVDIVYLKPQEIAEKLIAGVIDAGLTWEPHVFYLKELLGDKSISWPVQDQQNSYLVLVAESNWINNNPEKISRVLKALSRVENDLKSDPDVLKTHLAKTFLYEESYLESILQNSIFQVGLPAELLDAMQREAQWRVREGLTKKTQIPNYIDRIYFAGMDSVKKDAVTIERPTR